MYDKIEMCYLWRSSDEPSMHTKKQLMMKYVRVSLASSCVVHVAGTLCSCAFDHILGDFLCNVLLRHTTGDFYLVIRK